MQIGGLTSHIQPNGGNTTTLKRKRIEWTTEATNVMINLYEVSKKTGRNVNWKEAVKQNAELNKIYKENYEAFKSRLQGIRNGKKYNEPKKTTKQDIQRREDTRIAPKDLLKEGIQCQCQNTCDEDCDGIEILTKVIASQKRHAGGT